MPHTLPDGWTVVRHSHWDGPHLASRVTFYFHKREGLTVRKRGRLWRLLHHERESGLTFKTAWEAIEHAQDVIMHAG